jgi:D-glycero-alpha-D-manno-heptose 1-phosphate guanylyltransferase
MHEAVILAGGYGTRLRQVVADVPKPMAPISGRPFLEIQLEMLDRKGVGHAVLAVGYLGHMIIEHFGDRFGNLELSYTTESSPLGTGGAMQRALQHCRSDRVFVLNGDTYLDFDFDAADRLWQPDHRGIIVARTVPDTSRYGRLAVADGWVHGLVEKGAGGEGVINAGCYVLNRGQLADFDVPPPFSFENDYLARLLPSSPFHLFVAEGLFIDIGVPEDFARAQSLLAGV